MVEVNSVEGLMMNIEGRELAARRTRKPVGQRPDSADCSGDLVGKPGNTGECTIVAGPGTSSFTLTVDTVEGSTINYHYEPRS
jgi:hypothetical protein